MTSENPQIQTLLQQINEVLNKTNPRLPWVMSSDAVQQRQVLEQTRDYLLALQQNGASETASETAIAATGTASQSAAAMEASAQQVLQAVVQEMNYLRSNMMQPLRSDVEMLRMQRDALTQEIRQLEAQRQQYGLPQQNPQHLTEFLQAAMAQMQQNLTAQVAQMLTTAPNPERLAGAQSAGLLEGDATPLSPAERLERLQMMQAQSDQLMLRLDTTLRTVFESLQHNLQSYQDSLEEGLGRMHGMGQQGEAVFGAFVTRLGQILGREASSFLQSPQARSDRPSLPGQRNVSEKRPDTPINRLLEELGALDQTAFRRAASGEPIPFDASSQRLSSEAELENLEALDRALSELDLSAIPDADELDEDEDDLVLLQEEQDFPFPPFDDQSDGPPFQTVEAGPDLVVLRSDQVRTEEELDSAIDLLNQIAEEIPIDNTSIDSRQQLTDSPTRPSESSFESSSQLSEPPLVENPDVLYNDEFYQTLFGEPEAGELEGDQAERDQTETASIDRPHSEESVIQPSAQSTEELQQADAPIDLDADLFAGLNEFADTDSSQSSEPISIGFTDLPQSVENQLLQPPQPSLPQETLDTFFDGPEEPEEEEEPEEIETIAALTDLIPPPATTPLYAEPPRLLDLGGDYETAQPGEDLFGPDYTNAETTTDFQLPPDSLQQLSADLFDFEDRQPDADSQTDQANWVNWQDSPSVESVESSSVEPVYTGIEWSIADIPSVLLSQPFAGEMSTEDLLFSGGFDDLLDQPSPEATPETSSTPAELDLSAESQTEDPTTELLESTIEDWFSAVESNSTPTPEPTRDDTANFTIEDFADSTDSPASEQPLATDEPDSLNAFTLDGLDSLFEGVPSIDPPPPSGTSTQNITVDNIFGDWQGSASTESFDAGNDESIESSSTFPQAPSSPEGDRQKKKFRFRESND